jgi:hypothetical protein
MDTLPMERNLGDGNILKEGCSPVIFRRTMALLQRGSFGRSKAAICQAVKQDTTVTTLETRG